MSLKKDVAEIKNKINALSNGDYEKARKYEELTKLLKSVKIEVSSASLTVDSTGQIGVLVKYSVPQVKIIFDENGSIIKNNRFYAMNMLDLISAEDMAIISDKIKEAALKNKS